MSEVYFPFSAGAGSTITDLDWQVFFQNVAPDGVVPNFRNLLAPAPGATLHVTQDTGGAFLRGLFYWSSTLLTLALATANPSLPRMDRLVIHADLVAQTVATIILTGTPAGTPVAPATTQTTTLWEISIATILVPAAATTISSGNITDTRTYSGPPNVPLTNRAGQTFTTASSFPVSPSKYDVCLKTTF